MRFDGEMDDLIKVKIIADKWGYGNVIQYLQYTWADNMLKSGFSKEQAAKGAGMDENDINYYISNGSKFLIN